MRQGVTTKTQRAHRPGSRCVLVVQTDKVRLPWWPATLLLTHALCRLQAVVSRSPPYGQVPLPPAPYRPAAEAAGSRGAGRRRGRGPDATGHMQQAA